MYFQNEKALDIAVEGGLFERYGSPPFGQARVLFEVRLQTSPRVFIAHEVGFKRSKNVDTLHCVEVEFRFLARYALDKVGTIRRMKLDYSPSALVGFLDCNEEVVPFEVKKTPFRELRKPLSI